MIAIATPHVRARRLLLKYSSKTQVAREWRVVQVSDGAAVANRHIQELEACVRSAHVRSLCPAGVRH